MSKSKIVTEQDLDEPEVRHGMNQWKFVHGLLKEMVLNAIVSINYLRLTPTKVRYYNSVEDIKRKDLRKFYTSFMQSTDFLKSKYGISDSREVLVKRAFQMMITIADNDHAYGEMLEDFMKRLKVIDDATVAEYARSEKLLPHLKPQKFFMRTNDEVDENG